MLGGEAGFPECWERKAICKTGSKNYRTGHLAGV